MVLVLGARPAASQAFAPPSVGVSGPSAVTMPDGVLLHLAGISDAPGDVSIGVFDHNWNSLGGCLNSCDQRFMTGAVNSGTFAFDETFHVMAQASDSQTAWTDKTVTFNPVDWQVSLDMPRGVTMPDVIPASVTVSPVTTGGPATVLTDADTLTHPYPGINCATWQGLCSTEINTGWWGVPVVQHYRAEMMYSGNTVASDSKTVTIYPPSIGVTVVVPPFVLPGHSYTLKITNSYNQWTPYTIVVRDASGSAVGTCAVNATCEFTLTAGSEGDSQSFTASVVFGSDVVSQSSPTKVDFTDPNTAGSNDGINITTLAGLFGSISNVCNSLLFFPGTNVENTTTSDEENACTVASEASGATVESVITASLLAMAAAAGAASGQSLLAWLLHWAWTHEGVTPPWIDPGPTINPPTSTPVPIASAASLLADALTAQNAAVAALGASAALVIARACLHLTGEAGISGNACRTRPIFIPGSDYPTATDHRIDAIASWPAWVRLHRRFGPRTGWWASQPECQNVLAGNQCDEFPENRTIEGGDPGTTKHRPSLDRDVTYHDNHDLGSKWGAFLGKRTPVPTGCKIPDGGEFLVVPLPVSFGIPTQTGICNFPIP
jgi:hypothetical protein